MARQLAAPGFFGPCRRNQKTAAKKTAAKKTTGKKQPAKKTAAATKTTGHGRRPRSA
ncbi:hypothetical protein [Streptomyces sp. NPDC005859]|uniref:hypothetical protein n=1 Tax=Streptomyces sp. NPDC005859 TaxID=3157170 RepID=UPI0033DE1AFA